MNRAKSNRTIKDRARAARAEAEIGRILGAEEELIPSSGFVAAVMERVAQEAAAPPPIPFRWKRAVPGILLGGGVLGWGAVEAIRLCMAALAALQTIPPHFSAALLLPAEAVGGVALALGASLVSWLLARRLAGTGGLL